MTVIRYELNGDGCYEFNIGGALAYRADEDVFRRLAGTGEYTTGRIVIPADKAKKLCQSSEIVGLMDGWVMC